MVGLRDSSNYWRKRGVYARHCAEYARECAEHARSDRSRQKYLKIAKKYDYEADRTRERLRKRGSTVSDGTELGTDIAGLGVGCEYWGRRAEYARASAGHARACAEYARSEWSKRNYLRMATKYDQQANMAEGVEKRIRNRAAA
jgi:hypothetical protein